MEALCGALFVAELLCAAWLVARPAGPEGGHAGVLVSLAFIALLGLATYRMNSRLLTCGPQALRYSLSPRSINRPEFAVRMSYHLLINWSVVALVLVTAFALRPTTLWPNADTEAKTAIVAAIQTILVNMCSLQLEPRGQGLVQPRSIVV